MKKQDYQIIQDRVAVIKERFDLEKLTNISKSAIEYNNSLERPYCIVGNRQVFALAMLAIAVEMDNDYKNHIKRSKVLFTVDDVTLKPMEVNISMLKNINPKYVNNLVNCTACFRNREDISAAFILLEDIKKATCTNDKKE